jgi:transketolase
VIPVAKKMATRDAYGNALVKLGQMDERIVVLDADLSKSTRTARFAEKFPERFFQMGIAEQDMMGTAAGLAAAGKIPFASSFAIFATGRTYEQIRNSIGYPELNVKIAATHGGISVGEDGASHQAIEDVGLMRLIPGMTIIVPADAVEAEKAVFAAAAYPGPVYMRFGRSSVPIVFDEDYDFKIGKAAILKDGRDVTIVANGLMVEPSLVAYDLLKARGIDARVINMHTVKPLDVEALIEAAKETGAIVTAEEHTVVGGLGGAVCEALSENAPVPVRMIGLRDRFGQSGTPAELFKEYKMTPDDIVAAALEVIEKKG